MSKIVEVQIPNIGDYEGVDVIEIFVKPGDPINKEDSLITLESDKATMEIPSPYQGTVKELKVAMGDKLSAGALILTMEPVFGAGFAVLAAGARAPPADDGAVPSTTCVRLRRAGTSSSARGPSGRAPVRRARPAARPGRRPSP
ncbi:MAG: hypothetical protein IH787_07200 [Nitrospirae bacterium]|nr:hypothetical protein [Nitrospirota bacterium]